MKWCITVTIIACFLVPFVSQGAVDSVPQPEETLEYPGVALTLGAQGGEGEFEAYADLLIPLYVADSGLWFLNPRASANDQDEEEANIGLGYRHLFESRDVIIGANVFYDSRWTRHDNQFDQVGFGIECLTKWVDARANYYLPEDDEELADSYRHQTVEVDVDEMWWDPYATGHSIKQNGEKRTTTTTTTFLFERFEKAREGWDAEIGVLLPGLNDLMEVRVFGGYYSWDSEYSGNDTIEGFKGRLEARILPVLYLDAQLYENKELTGTDWYVGGRVHLPFDMLALGNGRNPFAGATEEEEPQESTFSERLLEMVVRDVKIQTELSEFRENESERLIDIRVEKKHFTETLMDDVTFVDDDADDDPGPNDPLVSDWEEDGSAEHPYDMIQEGVDNASSPVYVFDGDYTENVTMRDGVDVIGEGEPIIGYGGMNFGGGNYPTVNGDWDGPVFSMANDVLLAGFHVVNIDTDASASLATGLFGDSLAAVGIYSANVDDFEIRNNRVDQCSDGILLESTLVRTFSPVVRMNEVENCLNGLIVQQNGGTLLDLTLEGNRLALNSALGGGIFFEDVDAVSIALDENAFVRNMTDGLQIMSSGTDNDYFDLWAAENRFANNLDSGLYMDVAVAEDASLSILDNTFDYNGWGFFGAVPGLDLSVEARGAGLLAPSVELDLSGNTFVDQENVGAAVLLSAPNGMVFASIDDNVINDWNFGAGTGLDIDMVASQAVWLDMNNNHISHGWYYGAPGVDADLAADMVVVTAYGNDTSFCGDDGMNINALGANGITLVMLGEHEANGNAGDGLEVFARQLNGSCYVTGGYGMDESLGFISAYMFGGLGGTDEALAMAAGFDAMPVHTHRNGGLGLDVTAQGSDGAGIFLANANANGNLASLASEGGIRLDAETLAGDAVVALFDVNAHGNAGNGVMTRAQAGIFGNANIAYYNVDALGNGVDGGRVVLDAALAASFFGEHCTFAENGDDGLQLGGGAPAAWSLDFGDGVMGSDGFNSVYGNGDFGLQNNIGSPMTVGHNYWGGLEPVAGDDVGPFPVAVHFVDPGTDWLEDDPNQ